MVAGGVYLYRFAEAYPVVASQPTTSPAVGIVVAAFGLFVLGMGLYVHLVAAPEAPEMREGEHVVEERTPAQRNALAEAIVAVPVLGAGGYLLYFTQRPLYQPALAFGVGLLLFSRGLYRYWQNTLTTYFLTNQRVVEEYRFISLLRNEVPLEKVRGVEENRSAWDSLFGLGNVAVRAGASSGLTVSVDGVYEPAEFAELVRAQLTPDRDDTASGEAGDGTDEATGTGSGESGADDRDGSSATDGAADRTPRDRSDRQDGVARQATETADGDRSDAGTAARTAAEGPGVDRRGGAAADGEAGGDGSPDDDPADGTDSRAG